MKTGEAIKFWDITLKFDQRLRLLENVVGVNGQKNKTDFASSNEKCKSCYNKIDFAQLFYVLMDEGLLFFDTVDKKSNRGRFQFFLENNFTYAGDDGGQSKIKSISRQFSECKGYTYRVKQIKFLDEFIKVLQERKRRLESW